MDHTLELAYLGVAVADPDAFGAFLTDVIGLQPGERTTDGDATWRNDGKAHRVIVGKGDANDAQYLGFEAVSADAFAAAATRLTDAGFELVDGTDAEKAARRVADLKHTRAPWGVRIELVHGLAAGSSPFTSPLVEHGFLTDGVGFGHVVFSTVDFDGADRFVTEGLGMRQSDWLETELAPGIDLEAHFYHCNSRHHTLAIARAPFELPQKLHHLMLEANAQDAVGEAFDRAWNAGLGIASGLGRHPNDGMFSFYVVTPAGFQLEFGHGGRVVGDDWNDNRVYDRISAWGHQPLSQA